MVHSKKSRRGVFTTEAGALWNGCMHAGKLDVNEVTRAFKTLRLDIDPADVNSISRAFVHPTGDGMYTLLISKIRLNRERIQRLTLKLLAKILQKLYSV